MDILIRVSDGRVQISADSIVLTDDRYIATVSGYAMDYPLASYGYSTSIVNGAPELPADMFFGFNYNYASGAYVDSGVSPPATGVPVSGI